MVSRKENLLTGGAAIVGSVSFVSEGVSLALYKGLCRRAGGEVETLAP